MASDAYLDLNMKHILVFTIAILLFSCQEKTEKTSEIPINTLDPGMSENLSEESSSIDLDPKVGVDFINSYIKSSIAGEIGILEFTESNPNASENLKRKLEKMLNTAWEDDPEIGLGFDPFFDAQDFPMRVEMANYDAKSGYLQLKGIEDWDEYRLTLKLINQNGKTMVDGCGVVNIPQEKQAAR